MAFWENSVLSMEERSLLQQLKSQTCFEVIRELDAIQANDESALELVDSLKRKLIANPDLDISAERATESPFI